MPRAAEVPPHDQQPIAIEQRVGQQRCTDAGHDRFERLSGGVASVGQRLQEGRAVAFEPGHGLPVCRGVVAARKLLLHVVDGQPHGFQVDALQSRDPGLDLRRCAARRTRSARCSGVGRGSCQPAGNGTDDFSRSAQI